MQSHERWERQQGDMDSRQPIAVADWKETDRQVKMIGTERMRTTSQLSAPGLQPVIYHLHLLRCGQFHDTQNNLFVSPTLLLRSESPDEEMDDVG